MSRPAVETDHAFVCWLHEAMTGRRVSQRELAALAGVDHSKTAMAQNMAA